jgi:CheY-like chemotaxis protein
MSRPLALLVDDQADLRMLISLVLSDDGFEVVEADGGRSALERLAAEPVPDVVLLDVQMPVIDGWQTLAAIRSDERTAKVPVILCTVKSGPVDETRGLELGCDGFVTKPFDPAVLKRTVREVMASR